jgi:beta-lactam-binding protein with PASTA domain
LSLVARFLSVFRGIAIVIAIGVVFLFGVATTVYLSLRSPEVTVPDVTGKNRFDAEKVLADADLKFRVRAYRPSNEAKPDTVMFQLPRAGEVVKAGQTVAMDISRATKAGEASETVIPDEDTNTNANRNANSNTNANENKPRRPRNRNANDANANTNGNANRAANANRTNANTTGNVNLPRANVNRTSTGNVNARPAGNVNDNRRPVTPRPTPVPNPTRTRPAP